MTGSRGCSGKDWCFSTQPAARASDSTPRRRRWKERGDVDEDEEKEEEETEFVMPFLLIFE